MADSSTLAHLPRIDALVAQAEQLVARYGRTAATSALRAAVDDVRNAALAGEPAAFDAPSLIATAAAALAARRPGPPRRVINATGVVVHTNLGRAPMSEAAVTAMSEAAGPCDLEMDLASGERGSRGARLAPLLADACDAEQGLAVNNAAAALVLTLATLASGREVLVSRGELVEIGGSFRLPEIMAAAGVELVEVGTTNRTRATDYAQAGQDVAMILAVHPSNYRVEGFTERPALAELAAEATRRGVPFVYDAGSGLLGETTEPWLTDEPSVRGSLAAGADLVVCSGDKLLGGPQAGLLVGRAELVERCSRHPLARALRLDKVRIAALVATLEAHLADDRASLPVWAMLQGEPAQLRQRARRLAEHLDATVVESASLVGGGASAGKKIPSSVVRLDVGAPERVARALRLGTPPVVARVEDGALWLDPRTVDPAEDDVLLERVTAAL